MEAPLRFLYSFSTLCLTLAYAAAWFQHELVHYFELNSAFVFHLGTAGIAVLLMFFADLSVLFYFIGTGMWMKDQAKDIAGKEREKAKKIWDIFEKSNRLKVRAFPFATFGVFFGILSFVMGGALQVGAVPYWFHPTLATVLVLIHWIGFPFIFGAIKENLANLDACSEILDNVKT